MIVYINGSYLPAERATISIDDRGFLFADGVFETALIHNGGFFRLGHHLERFAASAAALRIAAPPLDRVEEVVRVLARENRLASASVRITLTRGVGQPTLLVTVRPPDAAWVARARRGWSLATARTRRPSTAALPAQLKALGRTYSILARHEAADAGADDALLLTDDGFICEGPTWNVFWRSANTIFTPELNLGVLAGVTRSVLIQLAADAGYDVREGRFTRADLDTAAEIIATMTSVGLVPIRSLDSVRLPAETPTIDVLQPGYWDVVTAEAAADPV
ncbi:branched-chain-amino-acid transaminase [soil metagenome]